MHTTLTTTAFATLRRTATVSAIALVLASIAPAIAQDATPAASPEAAQEIELLNIDNDPVGSATFTEMDGGVEITVTVEGMEPGDHGIHVHEMGVCDPEGDPPFASAGDHFNPADAAHGPGPAIEATPESDISEAHAGDLGNITVAADGSGTLMLTTDRVTLAPDADNSLAGANGSALVIHADADDLVTDPSGNSGDRIACGVLFASTDTGTPVASGEADDSVSEASAPVEALDSLAFSPSEITVSPGDTIQVINTGALEHDFVVDELDIAIDLPNGEMVEIEIPEDAAPGEYEFYCSIPGHAPAGMVGILIVE